MLKQKLGVNQAVCVLRVFTLVHSENGNQVSLGSDDHEHTFVFSCCCCFVQSQQFTGLNRFFFFFLWQCKRRHTTTKLQTRFGSQKCIAEVSGYLQPSIVKAARPDVPLVGFKSMNFRPAFPSVSQYATAASNTHQKTEIHNRDSSQLTAQRQ